MTTRAGKHLSRPGHAASLIAVAVCVIAAVAWVRSGSPGAHAPPWRRQHIVASADTIPGAREVWSQAIQRRLTYPLPTLSKTRSIADVCELPSFQETGPRRKWLMCGAVDNLNQAQALTAVAQPSYKKLSVVSITNATVDYNSAHPDVQGTIFTDNAAVLLQDWHKLPAPPRVIDAGAEPCLMEGQPLAADAGLVCTPPVAYTVHRYDRLALGVQGPFPYASGHLVVEAFPQVVAILAHVPKTVPVLVPDWRRSRLWEQLLELTGQPLSRFVPHAAERHYYRASQLFALLPGGGPPRCMDDANKWQSAEWVQPVRAMAHAYLEAETKAGGVVERAQRGRYGLVVDRCPDETAGRCVTNHAELMQALQEGDVTGQVQWQSFVGSAYTLREAIALLRDAAIVVGPHGAGFFHLIWCSPGTPVIEFAYSEGPYPFPSAYYALSVALELRYHMAVGHGDLFSAMTVDVAEVVELARTALTTE